MGKPIVVGTRESQLAMVQTEHVVALLQKSNPEFSFQILGMTTLGDQVLDVALSKIGAKSLFTKELEVALHEKKVDLVVHSLKDLPTTLPPGMTIGAILEREDPRDAVVMSPKWAGKRLADLPVGSIIGTNLCNRLKKLDDPEGTYDALLLAYAGLHRLGWNDRVSEILEPNTILHAVGQGALAVECRENDVQILGLLKKLNHTESRLRCTAERAFMRTLEGGCSVPLGVWTNLIDNQEDSLLELRGSVTSLDGTVGFESKKSVNIPNSDYQRSLQLAETLGQELASQLLDQGAGKILDDLKASRT
ncbi:hypothetical protein HK096_004536 [Nowakowskiella sp. JEL0078]|nr:hypothetical protein HK096_004536 [Nowakowskiella sp. JEL0078]